MQNRLTRLQSYLDGFPKALTDVDALAATLSTPDAAFAFVRDRVAFEPYPGVMKGPLATLLTRGGNSLDRALLLAAILSETACRSRSRTGNCPLTRRRNPSADRRRAGLARANVAIAGGPCPRRNRDGPSEGFREESGRAREKAGNDLRSAVEGTSLSSKHR